MQIKNVKVYGLAESIERSGYPMQIGEPKDLIFGKDSIGPSDISEKLGMVRATKLAKVPSGSGHDNFLKGIIVQMDLKYTQYLTKQLQRYNWFDYVSSQSQMHRLTHCKDIKASCNKYVCEDSYRMLEQLIIAFNESEFPYGISQFTGEDVIVADKKECFQRIISNCPMGYELWTGVTTNYLQLKTMYNQRCLHKHKLAEWEYFGNWVRGLPMSELITGDKKAS